MLLLAVAASETRKSPRTCMRQRGHDASATALHTRPLLGAFPPSLACMHVEAFIDRGLHDEPVASPARVAA